MTNVATRPRPSAVRERGFTLLAPPSMDDVILPSDWVVFREVIRTARARRIPFAVGGGLAVCFYAGGWHRTKDIDLYVTPGDRDAMVAATRDAGLADLHDVKPYDRAWIYRGTRDAAIVDVMWALANGCGDVDRGWHRRAPEATIHGEPVAILSPEDLLWTKVHVFQRERCDWPELLNLLHATAATLDWRSLIDRMPDDRRLLASLVSIFAWVAPARAARLPGWLWPALGIPPIGAGESRARPDRIDRLDTRPWFTAD